MVLKALARVSACLGLKALPVTMVNITKIIPELFDFGGLSAMVSSNEALVVFPCTFMKPSDSDSRSL